MHESFSQSQGSRDIEKPGEVLSSPGTRAAGSSGLQGAATQVSSIKLTQKVLKKTV